MTANRREFIAGTGATLAAISGLVACAKRNPAVKPVDVEGLLSEVADAMLADYPENATGLGIDTGARAALKAKLTGQCEKPMPATLTRGAKGTLKLQLSDRSIEAATDDELVQALSR